MMSQRELVSIYLTFFASYVWKTQGIVGKHNPNNSAAGEEGNM